MQQRGDSEGVNRNGMYSDGMRAAVIPTYKLIFQALYEYSNSRTRFARESFGAIRMTVTREAQKQEDVT
jgi:hypothetical protein